MSLKKSLYTSTRVTLCLTTDAHAYIDPGTGSAIIQGLIATHALVGVTAKYYRQRITAFFRPMKKDDPGAARGGKREAQR